VKPADGADDREYVLKRVTEYCPRGSLVDKHPPVGTPVLEVLEIFRQICGAVAYDRRICDADAISGCAESDLLLHDALPYDALQHLRIRFGVLQLCGSVRATGPINCERRG
jgi:hypothetical protein